MIVISTNPAALSEDCLVPGCNTWKCTSPSR